MTTLELSHSQVGRWADAVALRPGAAEFALPITLTPQLSLWRLIAQGSSLVYEGFDRRAAARVAVKLIVRARDAEARARALQLASLHANIEHPCIVPVLDVASLSEGTPYVVSELASGDTLAAVMLEPQPGKPAMNPALACEVTSQVLGALIALHRAGLVHGGLKPGAVLLDLPHDGRRRVRLLGACFADLAFLDASSVIAGVERDSARIYRAPEQLGSGVVNPRTDLYALGLLLHEMLTGVCPHADGPSDELMARRMREPIDDRHLAAAGVGPTLARFVCTALARDPAERFASADEMMCELHAARADESCLWRLPVRPEAVGEVSPESLLATAVVPISVHPQSPLDSAIWTHAPEHADTAAPRVSRSGWKALMMGFGVTLAAGGALMLPLDNPLSSPEASVAPVVNVESTAIPTVPSPAAARADVPAPGAAREREPGREPAARAPTEPAAAALPPHRSMPPFEPPQSAPIAARPSPKLRAAPVTPVTPSSRRRSGNQPRALPANPY